MSKASYTVAIAGSTKRTVMCAEALLQDERFSVPWVLTAGPKPVGRKHELLPNPVHSLADTLHLPTVLIEKKIDSEVRNKIETSEKPDLLLVVDFGYLVPQWLLDFPNISPLNIHPSLLPRWRGSSPGQFVLLFNEQESAVTLMVMNQALDQGPIITQLSFEVEPDWTQTEYYQHSFQLITQQLPDLLVKFCEKSLPPQPQPLETPTPIARRLSREDGFVEWQVLGKAMDSQTQLTPNLQLNELLQQAAAQHSNLAELLAHACRAFSPWPGLWTQVPTSSGQQRMKILTCHQEHDKLVLDRVHLEGKQPSSWNELKSALR